MVAAAKQVAIGGLDTERDITNTKKAAHLWREELWWAMRTFVESYRDADNGLTKHDGVAYRLNQIWEDKGRPVSSGALKNALEDSNRNNFRLEWAFWFASHDEEIARLLGCQAKPPKTAEQRHKDIESEVRATLSHREAEKLLRRADAR